MLHSGAGIETIKRTANDHAANIYGWSQPDRAAELGSAELGSRAELGFRLNFQHSKKGIGAPVNSMLNVETEPMKLNWYMKIQRQPVEYQKSSNSLSHIKS
jgi:predicted lysophospholipase L1 biosynthesis ABC-type transport system permease subunit